MASRRTTPLPVTYSGPILTGFALASILGGLIYGARTWPGSMQHQSTLLLMIMIMGVAATALASTWTVIAALLTLTGLLQAAVLITRNLTLREQLPADLHPVGYSVLYAGSGYGIGYGLSAAATGRPPPHRHNSRHRRPHRHRHYIPADRSDMAQAENPKGQTAVCGQPAAERPSP